MNLCQAPCIPAPRTDGTPIFNLSPATIKPWTWRNAPRESLGHREQQILRAVRSYDHAVRFAAIAVKVKFGKSALLGYLRGMVATGKLQRMKCNAKDYVYWETK